MAFSTSTIFRSGVLTFLCLLASIAYNPIQAQSTGYKLITRATDKEAAERKKNEILQLGNELFVAGAFTGSEGEPVLYRVLQPPATAGIRKYPLILIFHNSGRIGTDNTAQLDVFVKYWAQPNIRKRYPAYIVAVQFPVRSSNYTDLGDSLLSSAPAPCLQTALQLTDSLCKVWPVDATRLYTLGFSMGASTANNAMMARPSLFAAGVCISGIPTQEKTERLKAIPIWLIHGNKDQDNPIPGDRAFFKKRSRYKNTTTRFWEIEGLEHKIYAPLYTTDMLAEWLFAQKKK